MGPLMTAPALLRLEGVEKSFPGVKALSDMQLELRYGEVLALVGENGAGKSTLMKLLSGIYTADSGRFFLGGETYEPSSPRHARDLGISIIHQEFNLMPDLTVAQNIFIGREPRRGGVFMSERVLNRATQELLDRLQLPLRAIQNVGELTVAKQQMVEIAKALSFDAKVLIMDEPTAALNETEVATLHGLIRRFVRPTTGVIYISHRMDELKAIADRVTVIRDGKFVQTDELSTISTSKVVSLMVGRELSTDRLLVRRHVGEDIVLKAQGLSTKSLLKDVSFDLRRGEILGFAGLMGAGRTEVARALVGADPVTSGTVTLHGKPISISHPEHAAKYGIGYLSEDRKRYGLLLEQDVTSNVVLSSVRGLFSSWGLLKKTSMKSTARSQVIALRIKTPTINQIVKNLSGGNQQKVVIAKWLVKDCDVLIFDEPTRGIDVGAKEEIYGVLNELTSRGKSIIMISSELPEIIRMSDRIVVMSEGRITGILDGKSATQESVMHYATQTTTTSVNEAGETR